MAKGESKEDYERVFNELLGTKISWAKLPKEDLTQIALLFNNPEILLKKLSGETGENLSKNIGELVLHAATQWEGPVVKGIRKMVIGKGTQEG